MMRSCPHRRILRVAGPFALLLAMLAAASAGTAADAPRSGAGSAAAPSIPIEEHVLANGMKLVPVPQHMTPTVSGAWVAHVGSVNERPGITGISHLFEHMMFKGTHVIGTRDYAKDVQLIDEQERMQMLQRMFLRWAESRGFETEILDTTEGEERGYQVVDDCHKWSLRFWILAVRKRCTSFSEAVPL